MLFYNFMASLRPLLFFRMILSSRILDSSGVAYLVEPTEIIFLVVLAVLGKFPV